MTLSNICPVHKIEHDEDYVLCVDCGTRVPVKHDEDGTVEALCEGCLAERHRAFWKRIGVRQ